MGSLDFSLARSSSRLRGSCSSPGHEAERPSSPRSQSIKVRIDWLSVHWRCSRGIAPRGPCAFRRRLMTHPRLVVSALSLALFSISDARAQVTIDVSKFTCEQLVLYQITNSDNIAIRL